MITVLDIQVVESPKPTDLVRARVLLEVHGATTWYSFEVVSLGMPGADLRLIQADPEMVEQFRDRQIVIHQVRRLVGQAVQRGSVHLPQLIAA